MYFVFIDEAGVPGQSCNPGDRHFVMAGVMIHGSQILAMENAVIENKLAHGLSKDEEVKWNSKYGKLGLSLPEFISYRERLYQIIDHHCETIIGTVIDKHEAYNKQYICDHFDVYKNSLFFIMERVHYYLTRDIGQLQPVVFVLDSRRNDKNKELDKMLARAYRQALGLGTYYTDFDLFSRNVFFSDSAESIGIQLADHCAGPIMRVVKDGNKDWYTLIRPKIRERGGKVKGFGIKIFPHKK